MAETVKQGNINETAQPEKTFTQAELNAIVADRLAREREKYVGFDDFKAKAEKFDKAEEAAKSDLQRAQDEAAKYKTQAENLQRDIDIRAARDKVALETGVPASLLSGATEDECRTQANSLLSWRGEAPKYPTVRDGGGTAKVSGGSARDQFADWFNNSMK